jgi:hypothetical protein
MANEQAAKFSSPEHALGALAKGEIAAGPASSAQKVCLGPSNNGWFTLSWSATAIGTYDWVGLYAGPNEPDSNYVGGNNWQWASNGNSYVTNTPCQPNYEARYLIWDGTAKAYKSIARTGAFPKTTCSS